VKELDLKAVKELAVEELDLEVVEELAVEELNFEREGSGARDGRRSAARGTAADAQGGPAGARARPGRRAGGSSSTAGEEGQRELEHGLVQQRWRRRRRRGQRRQRAEGAEGRGRRRRSLAGGRRPGNSRFWFSCPGTRFQKT
jgi:hypothetical protein